MPVIGYFSAREAPQLSAESIRPPNLGNAQRAWQFIDGPVLLVRLAPVDYHHVHRCDDGKTLDHHRMGRRPWTVNQHALRASQTSTYGCPPLGRSEPAMSAGAPTVSGNPGGTTTGGSWCSAAASCPSRARRSLSRSSSPSREARTGGGGAFQIMWRRGGASLRKGSTRRTGAMPASGIVGTTESVATRAIKPEPATPLAPFEVRTATRKIANCCWSVRSVLVACATNRAARVI